MASKKKSTPAAKSVKASTTKMIPVEVKAPAAALPQPAAAAATSVVRDRTGVVALIAKLRDADAEVARDAAETLGTLPSDAEAVDALCAAVRNVDHYFHPVVRAAAAATLGKLGDTRAVEALIAGTGDTMAEASEEAVKALGLLKDARAVATLKAIVANERGYFLETVRRTAAEALKLLSH